MGQFNSDMGKNSYKTGNAKKVDFSPTKITNDSLEKKGDPKLAHNKLNLDSKVNITNNIKSSKDLRNVVLFGDKNEKAEKELKSIAANTLKAIATAVDPTLGALEHIARNDILLKLRNMKAAH
ncbi:MAG: hypothetical protein U0457_21695 [Candidatus Sericytochromatia bacterium]